MISALRSRTGKHTQIVLSGEVVGAVLGFLGNLVLLRNMEVSEYGLYSLFLSSMMMISGFMHFGWIDTFVRFGSKHFHSPLFSSIQWYCSKKIFWGVVWAVAVVTFLSPWIGPKLLQREGLELLLIASAVGAASNILFSLAQNNYRVHQQYTSLVVTKTGSSLLRFVAYLSFLPFQKMIPLFWAVFLNIFSLVIFSLGFFSSLFRNWKKKEPEDFLPLKLEMHSYNFWILISFLTTTVIGNIDLFILSHYHPNQTLGNYGAAARLTLPFQLIVSALTTALLPRLHQVTKPEDMKLYLKKVSLFLVPTVAALLLLLFLAPPLLVWLAGPSYSEIQNLIRLQILTTLVMVLANPYGLVLNAWGWSKFFALLNLFQLVLDIALDLLWIPAYGAEGAVAATLVVNIVGMLAIYLGLWGGFKKHRWVQ